MKKAHSTTIWNEIKSKACDLTKRAISDMLCA